ncbi:MAG: KpsF/GutQ family sugar-phosphate isomerase [Chitinophagales bacterium]|jgi:arabinose-5-phosphate isomerase|nr:KpsF/GutQ family sugar-phosphate isomerase [Bacteroidota bacterium]MBP8916784.1 KpsF/GutQ family sugar-phosphate isomerase [Chitinophagales bacterium]MBP9220717.1 KpsF/GutQ family sugar-phosphate isomerase [Chitinophagales bacterium]MBP9795377.1 KpsF/GutQ family sugar-phosphate isomerase [Chitinophagales bacterium]
MSHLEIAKNVLLFESEQIKKAMDKLNEQFNHSVESVMQSKGKLVVCGIGKSGAVAQKITATLCSTGTPAVFLHAAEAAHGDLGVYAEGDPVLMISKSGTTEEMLRLIPFFKESHSKVISIVGNITSPIARNSDYVLDATVEKEADALNLAPTASTTVALAIGDALAVALMHARGFTENDFARFHPGGQLGKNLLLKVEDVMHELHEIAQVAENNSFRELIIAMTKFNLGAACVVDKENNLIGLVTDGDVRRSLIRDADLSSMFVNTIMTKNPISISPRASLKEAVAMMENRTSQLSVLPVVEDGKCLGLIRIHDIYIN